MGNFIFKVIKDDNGKLCEDSQTFDTIEGAEQRIQVLAKDAFIYACLSNTEPVAFHIRRERR